MTTTILPSPVRLLFLTRSLNYGGAERQLVALAKGLWSRDQSLAIATFYPGGEFSQDLESAGVPVVSLEKRSRWGMVRFLWRLFRLVRTSQPQILHGYLGAANILTVLLRPLCPETKIVWGVRASNMDLSRYGWLDRLLYWIECRLSRLADVIIVNSYAGLEYAVDHGFPRGKMVVIHNGIDAQRFLPNQESRRRLREFLGIKEGEQVIGLVGRLDPMKGHETFLRAAAVLTGEQRDVRFICVGNGPEMYKRALISLSEELGLANKLIWLDMNDSPESIYNTFDIATSASYSEGFSNVIGEAMACGIPCVVTDVGDAERIVGDTGCIVTPGNPAALASAWQGVLKAGGTEMARRGQKARERIIEHFSLERLIEETARVLETAVKTGA
jgi:glycosyltransferase involved in cell wall biosynthesis